MHYLENDNRLGPLIDVEETLRTGVDNLFERNKDQPWFDGLWIAEYGEVLLGSLLVACQAYCVGCLTDINKIREWRGLKALGKIEAYRRFSNSKKEFSAIELINSAANCFKHSDEWGHIWPDNLTCQTLAAYSVTSENEFPLNEVRNIIENELDYTRFASLVSEWREDLVEQSKRESK